jgi:hypothetical protein
MPTLLPPARSKGAYDSGDSAAVVHARAAGKETRVGQPRSGDLGFSSDHVVAKSDSSGLDAMAVASPAEEQYEALAGKMVLELLKATDIPPGWLPRGVDDPRLVSLFDRHWPQEG